MGIRGAKARGGLSMRSCKLINQYTMKGKIFRQHGLLLFALRLWLALPQLLFSQSNIQIDVTVRDVETKEALADVTVRFQGTSIATATDDQSQFALEVPQAGILPLT